MAIKTVSVVVQFVVVGVNVAIRFVGVGVNVAVRFVVVTACFKVVTLGVLPIITIVLKLDYIQEVIHLPLFV